MSSGSCLKLLQLQIAWPVDLPITELRGWLRWQLSQHGEPLRWAITAVDPLPDGGTARQLQLEAVVLKKDVVLKEDVVLNPAVVLPPEVDDANPSGRGNV